MIKFDQARFPRLEKKWNVGSSHCKQVSEVQSLFKKQKQTKEQNKPHIMTFSPLFFIVPSLACLSIKSDRNTQAEKDLFAVTFFYFDRYELKAKAREEWVGFMQQRN